MKHVSLSLAHTFLVFILNFPEMNITYSGGVTSLPTLDVMGPLVLYIEKLAFP